MSNELVEQKTGGLVSTINQQGLGEMLKPLIKEIHLFDSYVAGTTYLKDQSVLEEIKVDDKLSLLREEISSIKTQSYLSQRTKRSLATCRRKITLSLRG